MNDEYNNKVSQYYTSTRFDIIRHIRVDDKRILEIGCGDGATLREIKKQNNERLVVGVDYYTDATGIDKFFKIDIQNEFELPYENGFFDVIIFADVLEHLYEPHEVLKSFLPYLNDDGVVISSIPNFQYLPNLLKVGMLGDFKYTNHGIRDYTHMRFFCKRNMKELYGQSGLQVVKVLPNLPNRFVFKLFRPLFSVIIDGWTARQFILVGQKS